MIDWNKPIRTKINHLKARFIKKENSEYFPYFVHIENGEFSMSTLYNAEGHYAPKPGHKFDLENAPD